jgi:hypothetical protein
VTYRFSLFCFPMAVFYAFLLGTCTACQFASRKMVSARKEGTRRGRCPGCSFIRENC